MAMNPGIISHCVKAGIIDAGNYFLTRSDFKDINHAELKK